MCACVFGDVCMCVWCVYIYMCVCVKSHTYILPRLYEAIGGCAVVCVCDGCKTLNVLEYITMMTSLHIPPPLPYFVLIVNRSPFSTLIVTFSLPPPPPPPPQKKKRILVQICYRPACMEMNFLAATHLFSLLMVY